MVVVGRGGGVQGGYTRRGGLSDRSAVRAIAADTRHVCKRSERVDAAILACCALLAAFG